MADPDDELLRGYGVMGDEPVAGPSSVEPDDGDDALAGYGVTLPEMTITAGRSGDNMPSNGGDRVTTEDKLLALAEGMGQGSLAELGQGIGNAQADIDEWIAGTGKPEGTVQAGTQGPLDAMKASKSPTLGAYQGLGHAITGVPLTVLAGPGVGAQSALGAGLGVSNAYGRGGGLPSMATSGLIGGATGALGPLIGRALPAMGEAAHQAGKSAIGQLGKWLARGNQPAMLAGEAGLAAARKFPQAAEALGRGAGQAAAIVEGQGVGMLSEQIAPSKAHARAYAGTPTTSWAVESVLSSGRSGLPAEAEQQLTEAVMSGDSQKIVSTNFLLSQRYPAYAKRMQDEYDSLQE